MPGRRRFAPGETSSSACRRTRCTSSTRRRATRCGEPIPPLAGLFGYEEASRPGCSVGASAAAALAARRTRTGACTRSPSTVLPRTPEWEVKCALGPAGLARRRARGRARAACERAAPSVGRRRRRAPDAAARGACSTSSRTCATPASCWRPGDLVVRGALARRAARPTSTTTNPLADHPSVRLVEAALRDERAAGWRGAARRPRPVPARGRLAGADRAPCSPRRAGCSATSRRRRPARGRCARAAGPPAPDRVVRRDERFVDPFNQSALIDEYCEDEARPADERAYALAYKRLREMDVPEWMAPIIAARATSRSSVPPRPEPPAVGRDAPRDDGRGRARAPGRARSTPFPIEIQGSHRRSTRGSRRARRICCCG